jgi:hypothetical protein
MLSDGKRMQGTKEAAEELKGVYKQLKVLEMRSKATVTRQKKHVEEEKGAKK